MQASNSFKRIFLKKFLVGLQQGNLMSKNMSLLERKNAIKLSSDVALAFARDGANWSRAIIAQVSKQKKNKTHVKNILGEEFNQITKSCKKATSERILRRCHLVSRIKKSAPQKKVASALVKRMLKKRTHVLKCIVPGGESMDDFSLLDEAADYILSLRAQVDVMRRLANVFEHSNGK